MYLLIVPLSCVKVGAIKVYVACERRRISGCRFWVYVAVLCLNEKIDLAIQVSSIQENNNLSSIFIRMQSPSVCKLFKDPK